MISLSGRITQGYDGLGQGDRNEWAQSETGIWTERQEKPREGSKKNPSKTGSYKTKINKRQRHPTERLRRVKGELQNEAVNFKP